MRSPRVRPTVAVALALLALLFATLAVAPPEARAVSSAARAATPGGYVLKLGTAGYVWPENFHISGDGNWVVYTSKSGDTCTLVLWDRLQGESRILARLDTGCPSAAISDDGARVAYSHGGTLRLWERATGTSRPVAAPPSTNPRSPGMLFGLSDDGRVALWAHDTGTRRAVLVDIDTGAVTFVSDDSYLWWPRLSGNGRFVTFFGDPTPGDYKGEIARFDAETGMTDWITLGSDGHNEYPEISDHGDIVFHSYADLDGSGPPHSDKGTFYVYSSATGAFTRVADTGRLYAAVTLSGDSHTLLVPATDDAQGQPLRPAHVRDLATGARTLLPGAAAQSQHYYWLSDDGSRGVTVSNGDVLFFDLIGTSPSPPPTTPTPTTTTPTTTTPTTTPPPSPTSTSTAPPTTPTPTSSTATTAPPVVDGRYRALTPARLADTRSGVGAPIGQVAPGGTVSVQVTGRGGVPSTGVAAVVVNVTAASPEKAGWVTAWPAGAAKPTASTLNHPARTTVANQAIVKVGTGGRVSLSPSARSHLLLDVVGYYPPGTHFTAQAPARVLDTRSGVGAPRVRVPAGGTVTLKVTGRGGVPASGVGAVALNVAAVRPSTAGWLTVWPTGAGVPTASNVNYAAGDTTAGLALAKVGADGAIHLRSSASTDLVADVSGWFPTGSDYRPLTPARLVDTRRGAPVAGGTSVSVKVTGVGGVPARGVKAVVLNVAAVAPSGNGYVTVHPAGSPRPTASMLNFTRGGTRANSIIAKVGTDGRVLVHTSTTTGLVIDTQGWISQ